MRDADEAPGRTPSTRDISGDEGVTDPTPAPVDAAEP